LELQIIVDKPILELEMLRSEKSSFRPHYLLQLFHYSSTGSAGVP